MTLDARIAKYEADEEVQDLLVRYGRTWAIDHGAAMYFHHSWPCRGADPARFASQPYDASKHVLLGIAGDLAPLHEELAAVVDVELIDTVLVLVPDQWLEPTRDHART